MALRSLCDAFSSIRSQLVRSSYNLGCTDFSALGALHNHQMVRHMGPRQNQPRRRWVKPEMDKVEQGSQKLTDENVEFLQDMVKDTYLSPLREPPAQRVPWTFHTQRCGLICRKLGTLPQWTKTGKKVLTTLVQVVDNHVISQSPSAQFGQTWRGEWYKAARRRYGSVVVGAESIDPTNLTDEYIKLFEPSGMQPKRRLSKFIVSDHALIEPGTPLHARHFRVGDYVDVGGRTTDRGFQGVMVRWGFRGGPASHGATKFHRKPGSIGFSRHAGRVWKGKKMAGHMGNEYRIMRGLQIVRMNTKYDVLYIRGRSIPGAVNAWCLVMDTKLPLRRPVKNPPPMPTHYPEDDETPFPEDIIHPSLHNYDEPTIVFQMTEEDLKQKRTGAKTALKGGKVPPAAKASTGKAAKAK